MRSFAFSALLLFAGSAKICSSEDKPATSAAAQASASASVAADVKATLAPPRIGGTVASAGELSVELAVHGKGLVEAVVSDARGQLVSAGVKLNAALRTRAGATEKVELAFSPVRQRFEGYAKAGVELAAGPAEVSLEVAGKPLSCKLDIAATLPEPRFGGHMLAAGAFGAEVFASPSGEVRAFITDSSGVAVKGDASATFTASLNAVGGARENIALSFDAARACFAGKAKAGVKLAPGPLELIVAAKLGAGVGRLDRIGLSAEASHGGQLVAVGDYSVELVVNGSAISAFVYDATGNAHVAGDLDLKLDLGARADTNLSLKWDAPSLSYVASAGAKVDWAIQPIRVTVVASGKAFVGAVASLGAAAKANGKAKLDVDVASDANAKAKLGGNATAGASKAATASVKVTPPKLNVSTKAGAGAKAGTGAKASAGFSFGSK